MTDGEKLIFQAQILLHNEIMTVLTANLPKATVDMITEHYASEMKKLTDVADTMAEGEKEDVH